MFNGRRTGLFLVFLCSTVSLWGLPEAIRIESLKKAVPLNGYTYVSNSQSVDLSQDLQLADGSWKLVNVGTERLADVKKNQASVIWIGARFYMDERISDSLVYFLLGRLRGTVTVYLNGEEIFSNVDPDLTYAFNPGLRVVLKVEKNKIKYGSDNTLVMRYYLDEGFVNIYPLYIGSQVHGVYELNVVNMLNVRMYMLFALFSLFISVFFILLFFTTGFNKGHLYYSLANFFFMLYFTHMGIEVPFFLQFGILKLMKVAIFPGLLFIVLFLFDFLKAKISRLLKIILLIANSIAICLVLFLATNVTEMDSWFIMGIPIMIFELLYMSSITIRNMSKKEAKVFIIFFGMNIGFLGGLIDAIFLAVGIYPVLWVQGYGFFIFNMTLFLSISLGIVADLNKLAILNKEMEEKIRQRTKYLEQSNSALERAISAMKESNKSKTEFLAKVSHEMRTPLNCIIGFGNALKENRSAEEKEKYLRFMLSESERLLTLINRVLELSRLQSGKVEVEMNSYRFKDQMKNLAQIYEIKANEKGVVFIFNFDISLPEILVGDGMRIGQICSNLLDNAVKFTHKGNIEFRIEPEYQANDSVTVRITVADTGIGIAKDRQADVFESFVQADNSTTRQYGGTGLGITISKQLVEILGGNLEMESEPGVGTKFTFCLPLKKAKRDEDYSPTKELVPDGIEFSCKVAVAEDYPLNRELMKMYLDTIGVESVFAANGKELLEILHKEKVDIIFLDIEMPIMDGQETAHRIKQEETLRRIPVIGITAHSADEEVFVFKKTEFDRIMQKPVSLKQIRALLAHYFSLHYETLTPQGTVQRNIPRTVAEMARALEVSEEVLKELLEGFNGETNAFLQSVPRLLDEANLEEMHRGFHSMKGGAANFFFVELSAACAAVCETIKANQLEKTGGAVEKVYEVWMQTKHTSIFG